MAVKRSKGLGSNPLSGGIFSKTEESTIDNLDSRNESQELETKGPSESIVKNQDSRVDNENFIDSRVKSQESTDKHQESRTENQEPVVKNLESTANSQESSIRNQESNNKSQESRVLARNQEELRGTNVRLPVELVDWVDDLVRSGSRDKNKSRIPKEVWFQAALELFRSMPVEWEAIANEDELREVLQNLQSKV